ncbi:MAG: prepilin-type N-terminal cleavage/methylation domain-containing protein [Pontiellaceae bacterium]|jgi:prepilin-type N-terminal cleavage/methylation domain-containing protein|nr:prepilin-type N-terminal cleavage/methylation domain-containing protein [Pontiellaceae bacterium]
MKNRAAEWNRGGFTLIEVVAATFILAIISVGVMMYSVQSFRTIHKQGNARAALLRAQQRMELIQALPVSAAVFSSLAVNGVWYLSNYNSNTALFTATANNPDETIDVNSTNFPIWSLIRRIKTSVPDKIPGGGTAVVADCIEIEVAVMYGPNPNERVYLKSYSSVYQ